MEVISDFQKMADSGLKFDCIYIDFCKAFNKVLISLLVEKCQKYGIGCRSMTWIKDYLTNRTQKVKVGEALSEGCGVLSGVPQGSCLGPVLFCLFINDLPQVIRHSTIKMFADDVKLYRGVTSPVDVTLLQGDLEVLFEWCNLNSMFVNQKKCHVMHYFMKDVAYRYFIGDVSV